MKQGWEIKKLGEICESDLGKTLNQSTDTGELQPYLCAINVLWDKIELSTVKQTRFEKSEMQRYSVRKGDLLICEGGDIGRAAIWDKEEPMLYQNALHRVRFDGSVLPRFCLLYLRSLKDAGILDSRYGKGVTIKHLVKSSLLSIPIPVPPLAEQEHIVQELDLLSGIIEKKRRQLKELDNLAQSIFYTMFGDPITNEKGWEVKKLGEMCSFQQGMQVPVEEQYEEKEEGMVRFLRIIDFTQGNETPRFVIAKSEKHMLRDNEVAIVRYGSPGFVCFGKEGIIANNLFKITPKIKINSAFFIYWLNSDAFQSVVKGNQYGVALQAIKFSTINGIPIILPPLPLQQSFAAKVEAIEQQKALIKQSLAETETLFNSRMDYYFN